MLNSITPPIQAILLLLILGAVGTALDLNPSERCPPGQEGDPSKGTCRDCRPGYYHHYVIWFSDKDRRSCRPCPPGTEQPHFGATGDDLCSSCRPGTYGPEPASTQCQPCPAGTLSGFGATKCSVCGPGKRIRAVGNGCVSCGIWDYLNEYSDKPNNLECKRCPQGTCAARGSRSITDCKPCSPGDSRAPTCSVNEVLDEKTHKCVKCPPGFVRRSRKAKSLRDCVPCRRGTFRSQAHERCRTCQGGRFAFGPGAMTCIIPTVPCAADEFRTRRGDCVRCDRGWRFESRVRKCVRCGPGKTTGGGVTKRCRKCPGDLVLDEQDRKCKCAEGQRKVGYSRCVQCPLGTSSGYLNRKCDPCWENWFGVMVDGVPKCQTCPIGTTSPGGTAQCTKMDCPVGLMPDVLNAREYYDELSDVEPRHRECVSVRTRCPPTYLRTFVGSLDSFFGCDIRVCNSSDPLLVPGKTCDVCRKGYEPRLSDIPRSCESECVNVKVGNGTVISRCNDCYPMNRYTCTSCDYDMVSDGTKCRSCPAGQQPHDQDMSRCVCSGEYPEGHGLVNGKCQLCPPGSAQDEGDKEEVCGECRAGYFAVEGLRNCKQCPPMRMSTRGASECRECPHGYTTNRRWHASKCVKTPWFSK